MKRSPLLWLQNKSLFSQQKLWKWNGLVYIINRTLHDGLKKFSSPRRVEIHSDFVSPCTCNILYINAPVSYQNVILRIINLLATAAVICRNLASIVKPRAAIRDIRRTGVLMIGTYPNGPVTRVLLWKSFFETTKGKKFTVKKIIYNRALSNPFVISYQVDVCVRCFDINYWYNEKHLILIILQWPCNFSSVSAVTSCISRCICKCNFILSLVFAPSNILS